MFKRKKEEDMWKIKKEKEIFNRGKMLFVDKIFIKETTSNIAGEDGRIPTKTHVILNTYETELGYIDDLTDLVIDIKELFFNKQPKYKGTIVEVIVYKKKKWYQRRVNHVLYFKNIFRLTDTFKSGNDDWKHKDRWKIKEI